MIKLNHTFMLAALVAGGICAADFTVRAQVSSNMPPAGVRPPGGPGVRSRPGNFEIIATQLALTDDQKTKAKPVIQEMQQKQADLRNDTSVQGPGRAAKVKEIRDAAAAKLKGILTPEQLDKWQKLMTRRLPGAGAPPPVAPTPPATPPQQ